MGSASVALQQKLLNDGLNFSEFCSMVRQVEPAATDEVLKTRFDAIDADGNGVISASEFSANEFLQEKQVIDALLSLMTPLIP